MHSRVSHKHLSGGGGEQCPPIGVGTWCWRWGNQIATSGGAVYISSPHVNIPVFELNIWVPIPMQWYENMSVYDTNNCCRIC